MHSLQLILFYFFQWFNVLQEANQYFFTLSFGVTYIILDIQQSNNQINWEYWGNWFSVNHENSLNKLLLLSGYSQDSIMCLED